MISGGIWNGFIASARCGRRVFGCEISKLCKASWQPPSEQLRDFVLRPGQIKREQQALKHARQRGFTRESHMHHDQLGSWGSRKASVGCRIVDLSQQILGRGVEGSRNLMDTRGAARTPFDQVVDRRLGHTDSSSELCL
ncbi:hypothetical protein SAMN03159340_01485 [Sphingomonas sp. NFR15]|nr:hypothetical protein SAMN03159340_01485 [Sphingomonas sp. NFR15]